MGALQMTGWCHASLPDKQPVANNQWVGEKAEERTTCNFIGNIGWPMISDFLDLLMTIFLSDFVELDWFVRHTTETINNIPLCRIHQFIENSSPRYGRKLQKNFT